MVSNFAQLTIPTVRYKKGDFEGPIAHRDYLSASGRIVVPAITSARCHGRAMKPRDDATPRRFMTAAEVAEYFNVGQITIYKLARNGELPAIKVGSDWRFDRGVIEKLVTGRTSEVLKKSGAPVRAAPNKTGMH